MEERLAGKNILIVIPKDYYMEAELDPILESMNAEGAKVLVASAKLKEAVGMKGGTTNPDVLIVDAIEGITGDSYVSDAKGVRQILQVLKQQRIQAILPDQQPKSGQGIYAPFMGQPAYTMTLFSKMAIKTQAPVVLAVAERLSDGKGFDLHFRRASEAIYADLETSVATLNQEIATLVNLAPSQYQWTYKRFSIQADGSKPYRPQ